MTVMDALAGWLWPDERGRYVGKTVSDRWRRSRRSLARHIVESIGDVDLDALSPSHVYRLQNDCRAAGLEPQTINAVTHGVLLALMRDTMLEGLCRREVYFGLLRIEKVRVDMRRRWRVYTIEQRDRAIRFFRTETDAGPLVSCLFLTGCRIGEAAGLRESDVDWTAGTITFERSRDVNTLTPCKDEHSQRTVVMSDELFDSLSWLRGKTRGKYLFPGFRCEDLNVASFRTNVWYPGLQRAGLPRIRIHHARHTWSTIALREGVSLAEVAAQLGDTMAVVQKVYAHVQPTLDANKAIGRRTMKRSALRLVE